MGRASSPDGSVRTSMERRRIRNARITLLRQRKWQEARLLREQEEQREAKEILERRRRERARLAAYIYSAIYTSDKGFSEKGKPNARKHLSPALAVFSGSKLCEDWPNKESFQPLPIGAKKDDARFKRMVSSDDHGSKSSSSGSTSNSSRERSVNVHTSNANDSEKKENVIQGYLPLAKTEVPTEESNTATNHFSTWPLLPRSPVSLEFDSNAHFRKDENSAIEIGLHDDSCHQSSIKQCMPSATAIAFSVNADLKPTSDIKVTVCDSGFTSSKQDSKFSRLKSDDDMTGLLQGALQERLENEAATSRLIAEITAIKSRLDDCRSKPCEDSLVMPFNTAPERRRDLLLDMENDKTDFSACIIGNDSQYAELPSRKNKSFSLRGSDAKQGDPDTNKITTEGADGVVKFNVREANEELNVTQMALPATSEEFLVVEHSKCQISEAGTQMTGMEETNKRLEKAKAWEIVWRSEPRAFSSSRKNVSKNLMSSSAIAPKDGTISSPKVNTKLAMPLVERIDFAGQVSSSKNSGMEHHNLSETREGLVDRKDLCSSLISNNKQFQKKHFLSEGLPVNIVDYKANNETSDEIEESSSKQSISNKISRILPELVTGLPSCKRSLQQKVSAKPPLLGHRREKLLLSRLRNKSSIHSSKFFGLSEEEKSILASIERLDMKLAAFSAKVSDRSRSSLISEGHQSTKSAPTVMEQPSSCQEKRKSVFDGMQSKSTVFPIRPKTSQPRSFFIGFRRRQNVGLTNKSTEKVLRFVQACHPSTFDESQSSELDTKTEKRKGEDGTILLHQSAQFLLSS